ncbi:MAG: hypothetical protein K2X99_10140 [Gemmatimonadaceae bacterium]|nr:hypothetical protein [Gemmatimonadaceae bacterium]
MSGVIDLHSHLIPGVDDGARDVEESLAAIAVMVRDGVTRIVTTPHFDGSLTLDRARLAARLGELDRGWTRLQAEAARAFPRLELQRGVELMLDVPEPDLSDARLRLNGSRAVLVEFVGLLLPPNAELAIRALRRANFLPVLAHPERYRNHDDAYTVLARCRGAGAVLQLNIGTLLGKFGTTATTHAARLLALGWGDIVSSDYHARGMPGIGEAITGLHQGGYATQAELLSVTNPARVLMGQAPLPVPPIVPGKKALAWWKRPFIEELPPE